MTQNITLTLPTVPNVELLDSELRTALSDMVQGVSANGRDVILHMMANASAAQVTQARQIAQAHDATKLTPRQQAVIQRRARLEQLRRDDAPLDESRIGTTVNDIRLLARKIIKLELELEAMRQGE